MSAQSDVNWDLKMCQYGGWVSFSLNPLSYFQPELSDDHLFDLKVSKIFLCIFSPSCFCSWLYRHGKHTPADVCFSLVLRSFFLAMWPERSKSSLLWQESNIALGGIKGFNYLINHLAYFFQNNMKTNQYYEHRGTDQWKHYTKTRPHMKPPKFTRWARPHYLTLL